MPPPLEITNTIGMEFVLIPAGRFEMGCSEGDSHCLPDERPRHPVEISRAFYLGRHEVTQAQWRTLIGNNPAAFTGDHRPIENVSWREAQERGGKGGGSARRERESGAARIGPS